MMCLDTNVIYHFLFEIELTERAERIVRLGTVTGMAMPMIVYNESLYIVGAKIARLEYGVKGKYSFRKLIAKRGFPQRAISMVNGFTRDFHVVILRGHQDPDELVHAIKSYRLAPSDAQVVITYKQHGIGTLASFDTDFNRVPWLKLVP
ncbi:MAG: PIN domain-containing protein [Candidatus Korarchaeota archaeon]|nr:PIN domain-containing protein [Candidatus Korarchaeota archaeon]